MPDKPELSEVKRALLEKYLHGDRPHTTAASVLTRRAEAEATGSRESVVAIQPGGSKRPFFFLHGDYRNGAYWCFSLARDLGADQPFYALEPYRFDGLQVLPTFEAIVAAHLKSLRTVQPEGPYLLGGFCNGGLLAYEMAQQLYAQGETVDLLALMDPMGLVYPFHDRLVRNAVIRLGNLMRMSQKKQLYCFIWLRHMYRYLQHWYRYLRFPSYRRLTIELSPEQVNSSEGTILTLKMLHEIRLSEDPASLEIDEQRELGRRGDKMVFALLKLDSIFPDPIFPTDEAFQQDYPAIYDWVAMRYCPPSLYPGKIMFFWDSEEWNREEPFRRARWRKVAEAKDKEVEVYVIPGTQWACRTRYLHVLAERLRTCLDKTQAAASSK